MKTLITFLIVSSLLFSIHAEAQISENAATKIYQAQYGDTIYMHEGRYSYVFNDSLASGKWEARYNQNNKLAVETYFVNGRKEGKEIVYSKDGQIFTERNFKNGMLDGPVKKYWPNGKLSNSTEYVKGKAEGPSVEWWENGIMKDKMLMKDDQPEGVQTSWGENGNKEVERFWKYGFLNGPVTLWYEDGTVYSKGFYSEASYDKIEKYEMGHVKDGEWKYWNRNAELVKTEMYENGKLVSLQQHKDLNPFKAKEYKKLDMDSLQMGRYKLCSAIPADLVSTVSISSFKGDSSMSVFHAGNYDYEYVEVTPAFKDRKNAYKIETNDVSYRTADNIGVGSTVTEILQKEGDLEVISSMETSLDLKLKKSNIYIRLDEDSSKLYYYSDSKDIKNLNKNGFVKSAYITSSCK